MRRVSPRPPPGGVCGISGKRSSGPAPHQRATPRTADASLGRPAGRVVEASVALTARSTRLRRAAAPPSRCRGACGRHQQQHATSQPPPPPWGVCGINGKRSSGPAPHQRATPSTADASLGRPAGRVVEASMALTARATRQGRAAAPPSRSRDACGRRTKSPTAQGKGSHGRDAAASPARNSEEGGPLAAAGQPRCRGAADGVAANDGTAVRSIAPQAPHASPPRATAAATGTCPTATRRQLSRVPRHTTGWHLDGATTDSAAHLRVGPTARTTGRKRCVQQGTALPHPT